MEGARSELRPVLLWRQMCRLHFATSTCACKTPPLPTSHAPTLLLRAQVYQESDFSAHICKLASGRQENPRQVQARAPGASAAAAEGRTVGPRGCTVGPQGAELASPAHAVWPPRVWRGQRRGASRHDISPGVVQCAKPTGWRGPGHAFPGAEQNGARAGRTQSRLPKSVPARAPRSQLPGECAPGSRVPGPHGAPGPARYPRGACQTSPAAGLGWGAEWREKEKWCGQAAVPGLRSRTSGRT